MPTPRRTALGELRAVSSHEQPHDLSDEAVLQGYAASDPTAAAEFVRRFERRVYGLALTIVGDPRVAEDVAQEALVRAWRRASVFDPLRGSVAAWLLTITRNLAIDAVRARRPTLLDSDVVEQLPLVAQGGDPETAAVVRDEVGRVREALVTLPPEQRRAVLLAGLWGVTAREIAERDGIPIGTAKTRIRAGLSRLRVALRDEAALGSA